LSQCSYVHAWEGPLTSEEGLYLDISATPPPPTRRVSYATADEAGLPT